MPNERNQIQKFFEACDCLINGTYSSAEDNISAVLAAIAGSAHLTALFESQMEEFDYLAAKQAYLKFPSAPGSAHGIAYLPTLQGGSATREDPTRNKIVAFVFCILVELDAGAIKLSEFLLRYFYVDGSFTASYAQFAERMIRPFRDILRASFPEMGDEAYSERFEKKRDDVFEAISSRITNEQVRIANVALREEEREAANLMFSELSNAILNKDSNELLAILAGYRYFLYYIQAESPESRELFNLACDL